MPKKLFVFDIFLIKHRNEEILDVCKFQSNIKFETRPREQCPSCSEFRYNGHSEVFARQANNYIGSLIAVLKFRLMGEFFVQIIVH